MYEASGHFQPYEFIRHAVGDHDIQVEILYARICHSDLHHVFAVEVTVFDITEDKREDALRLGVKRYVNNLDELKVLEKEFDFILSTIPAKYRPY